MENLVDVNGDLIGFLKEDGSIETKAEALKRIDEFDYPALRAYIDTLMRFPRELAREWRKLGEEIIEKNGWSTKDESVTISDTIKETTSDTAYYLDDDANIFMTDNYGNKVSLNKVKRDE